MSVALMAGVLEEAVDGVCREVGDFVKRLVDRSDL